MKFCLKTNKKLKLREKYGKFSVFNLLPKSKNPLITETLVIGQI